MGCLDGAGFHAGWVRTMVGLGQAETADPFAAGEFGQIFLLLRFATEFVDR